MGFVQIYKVERVRKARRKRKPLWQRGRTPNSIAGREAYAIAAKHEERFAKAFYEAMRKILTPQDERAFKKAYKSGSVEKVMGTIPFFHKGTEDTGWVGFVEDLVKAYSVIIEEAGEDATKLMNKDFGTNMEFSISGIQVKKAKPREPLPSEFVVVPVNPYAMKWMKKRSLDLIRKDMTPEQRKVVREILKDSFDRGLRAETAYKSIKSNIGLTSREQGALVKRQLLHEEAGLSTERVDALTDRYREKLLKGRAQRIARTETMFAQAEGRKESWRLAQDRGILPKVEREWMAVGGACEICDDLDGKTASVTGWYESIEGPVDGPPAHPHCACTETLRKAE